MKILHQVLLLATALSAMDGGSVREERQRRREAAAAADQGGMTVGGVIGGCCMLAVSSGADCANTCCIKPIGQCGTVIGSCACGTWRLLPTCSDCITGTSTCAKGIVNCGCGVVCFCANDVCYEGCLKGCCWKGLWEGCMKPCVNGDWVEPCGTCLTETGKCCKETGTCCAQGCLTMACCPFNTIAACGRGIGTCATECYQAYPWGMRCCTDEELRAACNCLGDAAVCMLTCGGAPCALGNCIMATPKCITDCANENCCTCAQCGACLGDTCVAAGGCLRCMGCGVVDGCVAVGGCVMATPKAITDCVGENCCTCAQCGACLGDTCACVQGCLTCLACAPVNCLKATPQCLSECNRDCLTPCLSALSEKGSECLDAVGKGCYDTACISIPANCSMLQHRVGAQCVTLPMRCSETFSYDIPRQMAWANTASSIKGQQLSALSSSASKKPWAGLSANNRHMLGISEEQADIYTDQYTDALDGKWAKKDAWTGFWRGDSKVAQTEGRNQMLQTYKKEFRRRHRQALADYMDKHWYPHHQEHYRSYNDEYMGKYVADGKISAEPMPEEQYQELRRYLASTPDQMAKYEQLTKTYNTRRNAIRDGLTRRSTFDDRLPGEPVDWQGQKATPAAPVPARQPNFYEPPRHVPAHMQQPASSSQGGLDMRPTGPARTATTTPVTRPAAESREATWICGQPGPVNGICGSVNSVAHNRKWCKDCAKPKLVQVLP